MRILGRWGQFLPNSQKQKAPDAPSSPMLALVQFLENIVLSANQESPLLADLERFRVANSDRQEQELPGLYLVVEQYVAEIESHTGFDRRLLRSEVRRKFPALLRDQRFGLIFEPDVRQKIMLSRNFLISVLKRVHELLGKTQGEILLITTNWLQKLPHAVAAPVPFNLNIEQDSKEDDLPHVLTSLSRRIEHLIRSTLGPAAAERIFQNTYDEFSRQYISLDTFPTLVGLIPHHMLDAEKIRLLSRDQVQQVLFQKIESTQSLNKQLAERNHQLEEAQIALNAAKKKAETLARSDSLTGLANRRAFHDQLENNISQANENDRFALILIDMDGFKEVNDTYGHQAGDHVLENVAERLKACRFDGDIVGRLGGDEFAVITSNLSVRNDVWPRVKAIQNRFQAPIEFNGSTMKVAASIGASIFPDDATTMKDLMRRADVALYTSKSNGRHCASLFTGEMEKTAHENVRLINDLYKAITNNELVLYYQPKIDLETSGVTGVEALLRWNHPELGLVGPDKFIEAAETSDLIVDIGDWVINEACTQLHNWQGSGLSKTKIAVNISMRHLLKGTLVNTVKSALAKYDLAPSLMELELTESSVIADETHINEQLCQLRNMGVKIALDDFGTGYSSLTRLKSYPIDHLKIDRTFVHDLESHPANRFICIATIELARNLGLRTIVEGAETVEQLEVFQTIGCDEAQGYIFSKPLAVNELERWILAHAEMTTPKTLKQATVA